MQISVIIITYNTLQMTRDCLDSVFEKTHSVDFEVILVDNASSDGSKAYFEKDARIKYIYSYENIGFGRANNIGYELASGDYIFLLNSDTILQNNALYEFYKYMLTSPLNVGCLGCQLVDNKNKPMHSAGCFPSYKQFYERIRNIIFFEYYSKQLSKEPVYTKPTKVDYITGADLFIRRSVIEKCGLFDPDFFMYFEETEMQYRYAKACYERLIISTPRVIHYAGASGKREGHSLVGMIQEQRSRYIYMKKTMSLLKRHIISLMHLMLIPRIVLSRAPILEKIEYIKLIVLNV